METQRLRELKDSGKEAEDHILVAVCDIILRISDMIGTMNGQLRPVDLEQNDDRSIVKKTMERDVTKLKQEHCPEDEERIDTAANEVWAALVNKDNKKKD